MGNHRFEHRAGIRRAWAAVGLALVLLAGCATTSWPWSAQKSSAAKSSASEAKAAAPGPPKPSGSQPDDQALQQVMIELQQVGAVDPAARDALLADLKNAPPNLWPLELQAFQAAAAYKRREEQREAERQKQESAANSGLREDPGARTPPTSEQVTRFDLRAPGGQASTGSSEADASLRKSAASSNQPSSMPGKPEIRSAKSDAGSSSPSPLAALPSPLPAGDDNRLALAPEPPLRGVVDVSSTAAVAAGKPGPSGAAPPEPPTVAARLAASRSEASANAATLAGLAAAMPGGGPLSEADWQSHLTAAIHSIETESKAGSKSESDIALQARLRMLYLLAGRREDAMRPLPAAPQASQDYWSSQIVGLSTWMDAEKTPDAARRAAETKRILGAALTQLGETAPLVVRNVTFCTEVLRFGSFEAVKSTEFTPGQKVLLYAEVDNLHIESAAKGYHWAVKVGGQIFDSRGTRLEDYGSTALEETFQTQRHDFFVSKLYYLPRLVPGPYTLQLTIEDTLGHKVGQSSIDFTVKPQ
jgi:hypothetical protein